MLPGHILQLPIITSACSRPHCKTFHLGHEFMNRILWRNILTKLSSTDISVHWPNWAHFGGLARAHIAFIWINCIEMLIYHQKYTEMNWKFSGNHKVITVFSKLSIKIVRWSSFLCGLKADLWLNAFFFSWLNSHYMACICILLS